jgi:hypothetical protein
LVYSTKKNLATLVGVEMPRTAKLIKNSHSPQGCQMICFQTKHPRFGSILEGLRMVTVGIFYVHLEYFMTIWFTLWPFGTVCGRLLYFYQFAMFGPRKIWQP